MSVSRKRELSASRSLRDGELSAGTATKRIQVFSKNSRMEIRALAVMLKCMQRNRLGVVGMLESFPYMFTESARMDRLEFQNHAAPVNQRSGKLKHRLFTS